MCLFISRDNCGAMLLKLLESAESLVAKDSNGLSDSYVCLWLNRKEQASSIVYKNLNPDYNEVRANADEVTLGRFVEGEAWLIPPTAPT